ncbi:transposon TX1 [Tanacetum coccineum]
MVRRGGFNQRESPDVIAMQETKYEVGDDSWVEEMLWVMIESSRSRGVRVVFFWRVYMDHRQAVTRFRCGINWISDVYFGLKVTCRLRDKLKNVKSELKQWSKKRFGAIDTHINTYCREAMYWELEAESRNLDEVEMSNWMEASRLWLDKEREKISILRQKARVRWDVEGDENSIVFFHSYVKSRITRIVTEV